MAVSLPIIVTGILLNNGYVAATGLAAYVAAWLLAMVGWGEGVDKQFKLFDVHLHHRTPLARGHACVAGGAGGDA